MQGALACFDVSAAYVSHNDIMLQCQRQTLGHCPECALSGDLVSTILASLVSTVLRVQLHCSAFV